MKQKLNHIGIIGLGVGFRHLEAYICSKRFESISVCDFDPKKTQFAKKKYPNIKIFSNALMIIRDKKINIISIASYDNDHYDLIKEAYKYNKHILVEKPICQNIRQLRHIYKLHSKNKKLILSSNLVLRTNPFFKKIKKEIKKNSFGKIFHLEGDYNWGRIQKLTSGWRSEINFYSIIQGAAIHMIDLIVFFMNEKPISVFALENNIVTKNTKQKFASFAIIVLQFKSGLTAKITANGCCVYPHFHSLKIFGANKTLIHDVNNTISFDKNNNSLIKKYKKVDYPAKDKRKELIINFLNKVDNNKNTLLVDNKDIFDTMSICLAAEASIKKKKTIKIKYL